MKTHSAAQTQSLYFFHPVVDAACLGGLSILTYAILYFTLGAANSSQALAFSVWLQWVINWPHFSATSYRLFRSRTHVDQFPLTSFLIPVLVTGAVFLSFLNPAHVAPYFIKLFMIWSPYHFSGQTLGLSLVYARRAGVTVSKPQRFFLSAFIFGTYLVSTLRAEVSGGSSYYGVQYPALGVPQWVPDLLNPWMYFAGAMFLVFTAISAQKTKKFPPWILFIPAITQFCWFIMGPYVPSYYTFVPAFHSLQYLLIAWAVQLKERKAQVGASSGFYTRESVQWFAINFVGGIGLFWFLPKVAMWCGIPYLLATGIIIAGVQIHHFFVDGVIWKLKSATNATPLMGSVWDALPKISSKKAAA